MRCAFPAEDQRLLLRLETGHWGIVMDGESKDNLKKLEWYGYVWSIGGLLILTWHSLSAVQSLFHDVKFVGLDAALQVIGSLQTSLFVTWSKKGSDISLYALAWCSMQACASCFLLEPHYLSILHIICRKGAYEFYEYRCAELFRQIIMIQCMIHLQPHAFPPVVVICRARSALSRFLVASAVVDLSPGEQGTGTLSVD